MIIEDTKTASVIVEILDFFPFNFRAKHKAGKLKLNSELCTIAQKWAEHLASISTLQHSSNNYKGQPLGENIASKWGSNGADYSGELLKGYVNIISTMQFFTGISRNTLYVCYH